MERFRLTILVESRIRWKVYVRFGGEYWETYHRNMTRRRVLSLHNQVVKAIHHNYDAASAARMLWRLEQETRKMTELQQRILALAEEFGKRWSDE